MPSFADLDAITPEQLRATGATKWTDPDGRIGAFIAEMDFGVAPEIIAAVQEEVARGRFGYTPSVISDEMSAATADYAQRTYSWNVAAADVFPMADVISVYRVAIERFTTPGTPLIVPTPSYMPFLSMAASLGRDVIQVPLRKTVDGHHIRYSYDLDGIRAGFEAGAELLVLCNPHNPTGRQFTREELLAVAEVVEEHSGRVFSDEIWAPLSFDISGHVPYASLSDTTAAHTITGLAASKAFNLPGLKCAQLVTSNPADREHFTATGYFDRHGAATLGMTATTAAYTSGEAWLNDIRPYLARNRDLLVTAVEETFPADVRVTVPEGTYIGWLDVTGLERFASGESSNESPADYLAREAGVLLTDGAACGDAGIGHARLVYAMPTPILEQALENIAGALHRAL